MKEKTFEELLKPHQKRFDYYNSQRIFIDKADVLQLLQQVREATIAECTDIVNHSEGIYDNLNEMQGKKVSYLDFQSLPTDRIKTEKL